jgi:predicted ATP-dependent endonuclease of OLD family
VEGLAGHEGSRSIELNQDVNVFYGVNGSGKTTLLKILHSAFSADASILEGLPFKSAEVEVYLNRHHRAFNRIYTIEEPEERKGIYSEPSLFAGWESMAALHKSPEATQQDYFSAFTRLQPRKVAKWISDPEEPGGAKLTTYRSGYLPITRLYRTIGRRPSGAKTISEEELDARFAETVQTLLAEYYADTSNEIAKAQEKGLANILHFVLSGDEPEPEDGGGVSTEEAYKRVSAFLSRQPGFADVLESSERFGRKYEKDAQIRSIVKQIDRIEKRIEEATATRFRLKQLLESMYTGNKRIVLTEKEIGVEISSEHKISLPSLSSGEKQLFYLSLTALQSGNHSLMIDEPELSMHVDWQKKLIASLRELNPQMQLIMATHSPEIMADLPDSKVFAL